MKPLRAFLFSRTVDGQWSVAVFRDWDPLEADLKLGVELDRSCLFLHVGFWRPETTEVSHLSDAWLGRILISQAAIHALPTTTSCSASPVQYVGKLPVHVCLTGYGYEISDPTNIIQVSTNPLLPSGPTVFRSPETKSLIEEYVKNSRINWVQWTIPQRQDLSGFFEQASISNDEEFLENEKNITDQGIRHELAMVRFRMLTGEKPDPSDFIDKIYATPYWFLDLPLSELNLTVRQRNVFTEHDLITIQDVGAKGNVGLLKLPNMGRKSVGDLAKVIVEAFEGGIGLQTRERSVVQKLRYGAQSTTNITAPPNKEELISSVVFNFNSFSDGINSTVNKIEAEDLGIWASRIGYKCQRQTLQKISEMVGLTRERIRQIESKIFRHIANSPFWKQLIVKIHYLWAGCQRSIRGLIAT